MTRTMAQRHEHLPRPQHCGRDILSHNRVAAGKPLFVPQPLKNPMRRVPLFLVNLAVAFKNGVNPRHKGSKLLRCGPLAPPISRRNGKTQHLRNRVPVNPKPLRRFPPAQPLNHHRMSDLGIKSPQCRSAASRRPNRTGTLLRRFQSGTTQLVQWYTLPPRFKKVLATPNQGCVSFLAARIPASIASCSHMYAPLFVAP